MTKPDPNCIFCKIVAGELPSSRLYEDERVIAFLDIFPLAPGHTLLIPRDHHVRTTDLPDDLAAAIGRLLPRVSRAVMEATGADAFNVLQCNGSSAGQQVDHVHFHVIPRRPEDGLGFRWKAGAYGEGEAAAWQAKIRAALD